MKTSQIFCAVSFLRISYQTMPLCQNSPICQSAKRAKYYQQTSHNFNKTAVCSHRHHWGIFVQGYTFGCSIQVRPSPSSGHFCRGVYLRMFNPGTSNPSTFLELCSPVDNRQCIKSPMGVAKINSTEKALTLTLCDCIPVQEGVALS